MDAVGRGRERTRLRVIALNLADIIAELKAERDASGPGERGRELAIGVTHLEDGMLRISAQDDRDAVAAGRL